MKNHEFARRVESVIAESFDGNASELARALGCEPATVSTWRRGQVPSRALMQRLATLTGRNESWFLEGSNHGALRTTGSIASPMGPADAAVEAAISAGHGPGRIGNLVNLLRLSLEPELRNIYEQAGVPFTDAYAGKLISDAVTEIGEGEPDQPVFHPELWPHLLQLVVRAHRSAVAWVSSYQPEPEPPKKKR